MEIPKVSCSKADRIDACNGSILPNDAYREQGGPDAIAGRACHEALACIPQHTDPPIEAIASKFGVDVDDVSRAVRFGRQAWDEVGVYFPDPMIEAKLESPVFRGTTDLVQVVIDGGVTRSIRILDWKTGHGGDAHPAQLRAYAHCAVDRWGIPENGVVSIFEVWTAHREIETTNLDATDLVEFGQRFEGILSTARSTPDALEYRAGAHCRFCPWRADCQVRSDWYRESATALVAVDHGRMVTRETLGRLYGKAAEVKRALYQFDKALDAALLEGPIDLPDGRRLERVESTREKIRGAGAIRAFHAAGLFEDESEEDALIGDVAKRSLEAWAKSRTARGQKAAFLRRAYKALRDADAIREVPHYSKKVVDVE